MTQDKRPRCGSCIFYEIIVERRRLPMTAQQTAAGLRPAFESVGTDSGECRYCLPPPTSEPPRYYVRAERVACHYHKQAGAKAPLGAPDPRA